MCKLKAIAIDDSEVRLYMIERFCEENNLVFQGYTNPLIALAKIFDDSPDIIFVDYMMPHMNGVKLVLELRKYNISVPIIMITSSNDDQIKILALEAGVTDFLSIPFNITEFKARVSNLLEMRRLQKEMELRSIALEEDIKKATEKILDRERETLLILAQASEYKDLDTELHTERVAKYSHLLAKAVGLDDKQQDIIEYSARLHDIGKIGIPDKILLKKGPFLQDEYEIMKKHTLIGYNILRNAKSEYMVMGKEIALCHHERYDGTGYPKGIKGNEIPLPARIVSVADVFDALTTKRFYKDAWGFDESMDYIMKQQNMQFDSEIVMAFVTNKEAVKKIYDRNKNQKHKRVLEDEKSFNC
jgi:Response regulator containing a CheY-like receiver domain and an HD-GYP domain